MPYRVRRQVECGILLSPFKTVNYFTSLEVRVIRLFAHTIRQKYKRGQNSDKNGGDNDHLRGSKTVYRAGQKCKNHYLKFSKCTHFPLLSLFLSLSRMHKINGRILLSITCEISSLFVSEKCRKRALKVAFFYNQTIRLKPIKVN